jgi:hypothetical protein
MRSETTFITLPAWIAVAALGISGPSLAQSNSPMPVSICSGDGIRIIALPNAPVKGDRDKCAKACHATCERKRVASDQDAGDEDLV